MIIQAFLSSLLFFLLFSSMQWWCFPNQPLHNEPIFVPKEAIKISVFSRPNCMPIPDLAEERANSVYILLLLEPILFTINLDFELDPSQFPANCKIWALESNSCNIDAIECSSDADSTLLFVVVVLQFKNHHQIGKKYVPIFDQNQLQKWLKITLCNIYIRLRPTHIYITPAMRWIYEFVNSLSLLL